MLVALVAERSRSHHALTELTNKKDSLINCLFFLVLLYHFFQLL